MEKTTRVVLKEKIRKKTQDPTDRAQNLLTTLPQKPPKANLPFLQWILSSHKVEIVSPSAFRAINTYYTIFNAHYSNQSCI